MPTKKVIANRKQTGLCPNCGSPYRTVEVGGLCLVCYDKQQARSLKFRKNNPDSFPSLSKKMLLETVELYINTKRSHLLSKQCTRNSAGGCTACHFWSGAIEAVKNLLWLIKGRRGDQQIRGLK